MLIVSVFFFQAEDGIRDLVRSRGLGDVYKRQERRDLDFLAVRAVIGSGDRVGRRHDAAGVGQVDPVSYTHLTLPTSDLV